MLKTILELYQDNGSRFPFWVSNDQPRHHVALVKGYGHFKKFEGRDVIWIEVTQANWMHEQKNCFLCDLYSLNKKTLNIKNSTIAESKTRCWRAC